MIKLIKQVNDADERILLVVIEIQGVLYTLGSLYAPTRDKPQDQIRFLNELERKLESLSQSNIILGGDFNCCANRNLDRNQPPPISNSSNQYRNRIKSLLDDKDLCDIWRLRHPDTRAFTFRQASYASRLDYLFIPEYLSGMVAKTYIHPSPHLDHSLLTVDIRQQHTRRGPGLWSFDVSLLSDADFTAQMRLFLEAWEAPPGSRTQG